MGPYGTTVELHITRSKDEYVFLLNDLSQHTSLLREKMSIPRAVRGAILHKLDSLLSDFGVLRSKQRALEAPNLKELDTAGKMTEFGSAIFRYMIPLTLREHLCRLESGNMLLTTDDVEVPWELLHDGQDFLCLKHAFGRKVQTRTPFREIKRQEGGRLKALFIGDPTKDLPDAKEEVSYIVQNITNLRTMHIDFLKQEEATVYDVLEKLGAFGYDIFHYAGHADFSVENPEESVLRLYDDSITASYLFSVMDKPPKFVFMNACSSAKGTSIEYLGDQGKLTGMATAFLSAGVDAYIGTLWSVYDEIASELSVNFYQRILNGEAVGIALRNAKRDIFDKYGNLTNSWASFILYGEPTLTLFRPVAEEEKIELRTLIRGAGVDGIINPEEYRYLTKVAKEKGLEENFVQKMIAECGFKITATHSLEICELHMLTQKVIVDILNEQGDTLVTIENEVINTGAEPVPGMLKDFYSEGPLTKEEFDAHAVSSTQEVLPINFVTDLPAYKKIFICFPGKLKSGEVMKYMLSFKMKQEYNVSRESEYWEWPVEIPTQYLLLKVLIPKGMSIVESHIYDMSYNKEVMESRGRVDKEEGRCVLIYELEKVPTHIYKITWKWSPLE